MTTRLSTTTLIAFFATTIALVAGVYALNTAVDPAGLRTVDDVEALARTQRADQVLVGSVAFDQRAWVRGRLAVAERCDVVVIGSSTLGMVDATMTQHPLLNAWLTGPTVEDYEGIVVLLERANCRPTQIVLGVDPWFVNPLVDDERWRTLAAEVRDYHHAGVGRRALEYARTTWQTVRERLNVATTERSIANLRAVALRPPRIVTAWQTECTALGADSWLRAADGHYLRCPQLELSPERAAQVAVKYIERDFHRMRSWSVIDPGRVARLEAIVKRLAAIAPVAIVTPPYHPAAYPLLSAPMLGELDRILGEIATRTNSTLHAVRDPATLGCTEFGDSHHMLPACARRLAQRVIK